MYYIIKLLEKIFSYIYIKFKLLYWKIKYGKRIKIGKNIKFRKNLIIEIGKNGYLQIGNDNFFNNYCSINCLNRISIGSDNLFGENVKIYDHNHIFNDLDVDFKKEFKVHEINIGNRNWIGSNVILLSKSMLGDNIVIGAGCTVNENVDDNNLLKLKDKYIKEKINLIKS